MANDAEDRCSDCSRRSVNRRELLRIAGATTGLVVLAGAGAGCGHPSGSPPTGPVAAGNISALAVGSLLVMSNVAVGRDDNGVYAMSAVCTHEGCLLDDGSHKITAGLSCPCHGSAFDGAGNVTAGPARSALQHYAVTIAADGGMTVEGDQLVSAATRTPAA